MRKRTKGEEGLSTEDCSGQCAMGHYCPAGSVSAYQYACPAGRFGGARGLTDGLCAEVRITPTLGHGAAVEQGRFSFWVQSGGVQLACSRWGSIITRFLPNFAKQPPRLGTHRYTGDPDTHVVLPPLSSHVSEPVRARWMIRRRKQGTLLCSTPLRPFVIRPVPPNMQEHVCPRAEDAACLTSLCDPGYFCPPGSISARAHACGSGEYFCPRGSGFPTPVDTGHYTYVEGSTNGGFGDLWSLTGQTVRRGEVTGSDTVDEAW